MKDIINQFDHTTFGSLYADEYDGRHNPGTTDLAVSLLAELAGAGKVLELAIGTGRVAIPLANLGIDVQGLEGSPDMVEQLRAKEGGDRIPVTLGDMTDVNVDDEFDFVFLIFNTFFNLTSQDAQVRCFENVAHHLNPGGGFLVETFIPDLSVFHNHRSIRTQHLDMDTLIIEAGLHDPVNQTIEYQRAYIDDSGVTLKPLPMRYAWPSEIDLMARSAGLSLEARWGGWDRQPFDGDSEMHVSLYRKAIR